MEIPKTVFTIHTYYLFTGGSLPDKLDRHPWYLDFPRWHDTRKGNSDRTFASAAQLKAATMQNDVSLTNLKLQFLSTYLLGQDIGPLWDFCAPIFIIVEL